MSKEDLEIVCNKEFETFLSAIQKMGFDPSGFALMVLLDKKSLSRKKLLNRFNTLTEEEKIAIENRINLFS